MPGYFGILPSVFPFRIRCSYEDAQLTIDFLMEEMRDGFALTSHPETLDGHVHLWLTVDSAEYLMATEYIRENMLETTGVR